ncbi:MAG: hypothetical protein WC332_00810 [Clostridia bacterium]|jgi:hypothetical protein
MKFKKEFTACRWDDDLPVRVAMLHFPKENCYSYKEGICKNDNKPCKVVKYIREK